MKNVGNFINGMDEFFKRIDESSHEEGEKIIDEMYVFCIENQYNDLSEGYIYDSETIVEDLVYFLSVGDVVKSRFLCYVLNTHYKGATSKLMEDLLADEKYELCSVLSKVIDTKELPSER